MALPRKCYCISMAALWWGCSEDLEERGELLILKVPTAGDLSCLLQWFCHPHCGRKQLRLRCPGVAAGAEGKSQLTARTPRRLLADRMYERRKASGDDRTAPARRKCPGCDFRYPWLDGWEHGLQNQRTWVLCSRPWCPWASHSAFLSFRFLLYNRG